MGNVTSHQASAANGISLDIMLDIAPDVCVGDFSCAGVEDVITNFKAWHKELVLMNASSFDAAGVPAPVRLASSTDSMQPAAAKSGFRLGPLHSCSSKLPSSQGSPTKAF